jgi:hypothetical protein
MTGLAADALAGVCKDGTGQRSHARPASPESASLPYRERQRVGPWASYVSGIGRGGVRLADARGTEAPSWLDVAKAVGATARSPGSL